MSGTIQIAVRTNDGAKAIVNGYTRSAYEVFSYVSFFDGDDGPAKRFLEEWKDSSWGTPDCLEPLEYGLFLVDFVTHSIVVDHDHDVSIDRVRYPNLRGRFMQECMAAGRVRLEWADDVREPVVVTQDLADRWHSNWISVDGDKAAGLTPEDMMKSYEWVIDFSPWTVRCHPTTAEGRQAFFDDLRACGFEVDPARWDDIPLD